MWVASGQPTSQDGEEFDGAVPVDVFERLWAAYRDRHTPRMGLRERRPRFAHRPSTRTWLPARFTHLLPRRFSWEDESTWPYFADRLDWLARELDPPPAAKRGWEAHLQGIDVAAVKRAKVLASFPQPPARFIPRLWETRWALPSGSTTRPTQSGKAAGLPRARARGRPWRHDRHAQPP